MVDQIYADAVPFHPPRFDINSMNEMLEYLQEHGYAVIAGVATEKEIADAKENFWSFFEFVNPQIKRNDASTWSNSNWLGDKSTGIISSCGFNHSDFSWNTRLLPSVRKTFSSIWNEPERNLIVSFDAGNAFRPWTECDSDWKTISNWWHVDQNA